MVKHQPKVWAILSLSEKLRPEVDILFETISISRHFTTPSRADFLETLQSSIVASTPPRVYMTTRVLCLFGATEGGGRKVGTPTFLHPVHLATVNSRCGGGSVSPADTVMGGGNSLARLSHGCSTRGIHTYVLPWMIIFLHPLYWIR